MNVMALPPGLTRLSWQSLARERWRNGQGWTRPVAQALSPNEGALLWRVSLAEITQASEFSRFDGMDRTTVLVQGGPVALQAPQARWTLAQPGDAAQYPGEWAVQQSEPAQPSVFWNVMVSRGQAQAQVQVCHAAMALPTQGTHLVWVLQGGFELLGPGWSAGVLLGPEEGLCCQLAESGWCLRPTEPGAACLLTQIQARA